MSASTRPRNRPIAMASTVILTASHAPLEQERGGDVAQKLAEPCEEAAGLRLLALFALSEFLERDAPSVGDAVADENQQDPKYARYEQGPAETFGERHLR